MYLKDLVKSWIETGVISVSQPLCGKEMLEPIKEHLLQLEDFKHVKILNILEYPNFIADIEGNPITPEEEAFKTTQPIHVNAYKYNSGLSEIIDLHSIAITPIQWDPNIELPKGIWLTPSIVGPGFNLKKEIKVIFNPEQMQDNSVLKPELVDSLVNEFKNVLLSGKINVPYYYEIILRISPRSINKEFNTDTLGKVWFNELKEKQ